MTELARRYMGNSVPRKEDPTLLTGHSNFTDDIRLPGMLHMAFLRSPYAHARITSIDASAARERPGVVAVFTSGDLADVLDGSARDAESAPGYAVDTDESIVDALARELDMDPAELRLKNLLPPFDEPTTNPAGVQYDSGNYEACMRKALELADYEGVRAEQRRRREAGDAKQIGIGNFTESGGLSPSKVSAAVRLQSGGWEAASVRMLASGKVEVVTGTSPHGQGHVTSWSQIAADALGVDVDHVEVLHGDTAIAPYGRDTYGSRSLPVGGVAVHLACEKVVEKGKKIAAHMLEAAEEDIEFEGGRFSVAGSPNQNVAIQNVAAAA